MAEALKPVRWIGTSLRDLRSFPAPVRTDFGHALFTAQEGKTDPAAKPLKGFGGASVFEIVASHRGNTWRAVYTVAFSGRHLCFARLSEEIHEGYCHAGQGDRADQATARGSGAGL
jgi:phage-related protein